MVYRYLAAMFSKYGVQVPGGPADNEASNKEVKAWADKMDIKFLYGATAMNLETWEFERTYFFNNEQDKLTFLLRWSNTR